MCDRFFKLFFSSSLLLGVWGCGSLPSSLVSIPSQPETVPSPSSPDSLMVEPPTPPTPSPVADFVITMTLNSPQDLQVKAGDLVTRGKVLSRNLLKHQELLQKQKQLELLLQQKVIPLKPPQVDVRQQQAALKLAKLTVTQSQQKYQQLNESLRFKDMTLAAALDTEKVEQMQSLEEQTKVAKQRITLLTNEIEAAQENYFFQVANHRQAERTRQQEIKILLSQIQGVKQQLKGLSILSPISGTISRIEYKGQSNQALTAKVIIKPDLESVTSPLTVPLPNVSPVPRFILPSP